ncbi:unnamed protein product [Parnassius apollo]|uniref:(apollo) hypothetical protein n=1 Tax=Parnassius apollo TaxID=110799 RepID=A0A8S3W614_PARAO|nr:unnamed protein product [Parnassius apollo]
MRLQEDDLLGEDEEIGDDNGHAVECIREPHSDDKDAVYIWSDHDTDSESSETEVQDTNLDNVPSTCLIC